MPGPIRFEELAPALRTLLNRVDWLPNRLIQLVVHAIISSACRGPAANRQACFHVLLARAVPCSKLNATR